MSKKRESLRWVRRIWCILGIALMVVGAPGTLDDLSAWREWLSVDAETFRAIWIVLGVVSIGVPIALEVRDFVEGRRPRRRVQGAARRRPSSRLSSRRAEAPDSLKPTEAAQIVVESPVVSLIAKLSEPDEPPGTIRSALVNPQEQERLAARKVAIAERLIRDFEQNHPDGDLGTLKEWLERKNYEVATKGVPHA